MDTLDKYLVRELVIYFLLVLLGISALAVGIDFLSKFWSTGASFSRAMEIYAYKVPQALQQFVPVAALMATLLVVSNMARQNEILALYAAGLSNIRLISTFVAVVASLSTLAFLIFDPLIPIFEGKRVILEKGGSPDKSSSIQIDSNPSSFWYRSDQLIYNVGAFYSQSNTLRDLKVYFLGTDFQILKKIEAKKALFEDGDWTLEDGIVVDYPIDNPFPESHLFFKMRGVIPEKPSDYKTLKVEETTMRLRDLRRFIERSQRYGVDTTLQKVSYHERVAHVFSPLIFVLLGLAFSLNPLKTQSAAKGVALSFLLVFIYLILSRMTISVGKGGLIPAFVAAWLPNMLFLSFAGLKIMRR
ncbi:MAG: LptF/LptG family permease [Proteobacteria bacterium]|nr:LptF/LptG family permease [Pseudomonadota bacterium]NDC22968.1 LptF/LptG family permease [Pseudomonadota bacterium]NDD03425.1 LptF/LptG family permease [Pseudomonadota bacterium]NDG25553.1 LptF/LptG family permease [Pseudomonadota bacterium]